MSAMPTPIQEAPIVHLLSVEEVIEVRNTRTCFDPVALAELAADIAKRGVLQPIFVRRIETPNGDGYELIFGGRRLRGSRLAGASTIPAIIVEMSDAEVLETQIIENAKRKDITEIEEAESYERLQTEHGYSVADISAKIGKSIGYVYARLKLCALVPEARAALSAGRLTPSTALLVARVPAELQKDALTELEADEEFARDEEPIGAREALARVQRRFMLNLDGAPFDTHDAELVPAAGACTSCVKRTGNQPELFSDVKAKDTCTDPTCFAGKKDASWIKLKTKAEAEGRAVIEGKEAKKLIQNGRVVAASGFIDLAERNFAGVDYAKAKTFGEQLGKKAPETILVRDDRGEVHELVDAKAATKVLEAKGIEVARPVTPGKPPKPPSANDTAKREAQKAAALVAVERIAAAVEKKEPDRVFWRALVDVELDMGNPIDAVLERRGFAVKGTLPMPEDEKRFRESLDKLSVAQLRGLFVELAITESVEFYRPEDNVSVFARWANAFKIDMKKLVEAELAKVKAPKPPPDGPKKYVISTDGGKTMTVTKQESVPAKSWQPKKKTPKKKAAKKGSKK
jgi:ParB/RepB/Spo0J family partition protein